ncbi:unnamed protein product [Prorocentrum cordatum]|uniref:PPPDE domain-containing protein n=1 Tax=Prorocentrum cordatum TaxID=2364126 RepID=A0ABN9W3N8_9DINO|nr:unnamed protein product [Polarella glacialis]
MLEQCSSKFAERAFLLPPPTPQGLPMGSCASYTEDVFYEAIGRRLQVKLAATVLFSIPTGSQLTGAEPTDAYHTSIILNSAYELVFSSRGVMRLPPFESHRNLNHELLIEDVGHSYVDVAEMMRNVLPYFKPGTYDLIRKNCNSFTDCALFFLLGIRLDPKYRVLDRLCKWGQNSFGLVDGLKLIGSAGGHLIEMRSSANFDHQHGGGYYNLSIRCVLVLSKWPFSCVSECCFCGKYCACPLNGESDGQHALHHFPMFVRVQWVRFSMGNRGPVFDLPLACMLCSTYRKA